MAVVLTGDCPLCGAVLRVRHRRSDGQPFVGCTGYPDCSYTCDYDVALEQIQDEIDVLRRQTGDRDRSSVRRDLRGLVFAFHPDRNGPVVDATRVVAEINRLIERLK